MKPIGLTIAAAAALALTLVSSAIAQQPTDAQRSALRSNCATDFQSHCSGVSPGGMDALMCLERNEASLSAGCKSAVDAIKGGSSSSAAQPAASSAAAKPAQGAAPAKTAPAAAAAPAAAPPMSLRAEMRLAARSCFGDFSRFCPNLPMGQGNMLRCLKANASKLSPTCRTAMQRAGH